MCGLVRSARWPEISSSDSFWCFERALTDLGRLGLACRAQEPSALVDDLGQRLGVPVDDGEGQSVSWARPSRHAMTAQDALLRLVELAELQESILLVVHGVLVVGIYPRRDR